MGERGRSGSLRWLQPGGLTGGTKKLLGLCSAGDLQVMEGITQVEEPKGILCSQK